MRKIEWSQRAKREFDEAFKYWIKHNESDIYSQKLLEETLRKINLIAKNPLIGEKLLNNRRRVLVLENFSVIYKTLNHSIKISAFLTTEETRIKFNLINFNLSQMIL
jgi:plasmid stabilization system protein ParE